MHGLSPYMICNPGAFGRCFEVSYMFEFHCDPSWLRPLDTYSSEQHSENRGERHGSNNQRASDPDNRVNVT